MKSFQFGQNLADPSGVHDPTMRSFLTTLTSRLSSIFQNISLMPFNRSETLSVANTGTADTEFSVDHHLGRVPDGYILTKSDRAAVVYNGDTANTDGTVYLKCAAANAAITFQLF
jgi:hypothetical protein